MKNKCTIKNGHPYTEWCVSSTSKEPSIDAHLVSELTKAKQSAVFKWIRENVTPRKTANYYHTSYGMKHILQQDIGIYMTNNQFKDAMMMCGFYPIEETELNWRYRISENSPCFRKRWVYLNCACGNVIKVERDSLSGDYMRIKEKPNYQAGFSLSACCGKCGRLVTKVVWTEVEVDTSDNDF